MSMGKMDDSLSEILNIQPDEAPSPRKDGQPLAVKTDMDEAEKDFQKARENLRELISLGFVAVDGALKVATEVEEPRAYEVVAQMIKAVAETNKDLVELHQRMKTIKQEKYQSKGETNINNALFLGSTKDLQELINPKRSFSKAMDEARQIIDQSEAKDGEDA
jgi:hypothetical protein